MEVTQEWFQIVATGGVSFLIVVFLMWAGVKLCRWTGEKVVEPMTHAAVGVLQAVKVRFEQDGEAIKDLDAETEKLREDLREEMKTLCNYPAECPYKIPGCPADLQHKGPPHRPS